jgi:hypothetical protein
MSERLDLFAREASSKRKLSRAPVKAVSLTGTLPEIECRYHHFIKSSALGAAPNIVLDLPAALEDPLIWRSAGLPGGACDNFGRVDQGTGVGRQGAGVVAGRQVR